MGCSQGNGLAYGGQMSDLRPRRPATVRRGPSHGAVTVPRSAAGHLSVRGRKRALITGRPCRAAERKEDDRSYREDPPSARMHGRIVTARSLDVKRPNLCAASNPSGGQSVDNLTLSLAVILPDLLQPVEGILDFSAGCFHLGLEEALDDRRHAFERRQRDQGDALARHRTKGLPGLDVYRRGSLSRTRCLAVP